MLSRIGIHGPIGSKILKNFVGPVRFHGQTDFGSWIPDQGLKELYIMSADVEDLTKNIIRYRDQERFIQSKFFRKIFKSCRRQNYAKGDHVP